QARRTRLWIDLMYTIARGLVSDLVVARRSWFDLDDEDLRGWLQRHGARPETVGSSPVRGMYAAVFSAHHPFGAGSLLQSMLRAAFTFKGAVMYKMQGGMGDVVFAPPYQV